MSERLEALSPGMRIVYGGDRVTQVPVGLAGAFRPGDRLVVVQDTGDLLHIPETDHDVATAAVDRAAAAFSAMGAVPDSQIDSFYLAFAERLAADDASDSIRAANAADVAAARERGRSTTRLVLSDKMRADMISGLRSWAAMPGTRGEATGTISHHGWRVDQIKAGLGVVGFVFEGRPNVFADATGVLRSGNTVVFRIGSDALGTARAIVAHALDPALAEAGLPDGAVVLVDSSSRAAGWAMFSDPRLALAVARGSGAAVAQLGAVARQAGTPVSLHGTGGGWVVAGRTAPADHFAAAVYHSLDRKVCNTLNTCCIVAERAGDLVPTFLDALARAGTRRSAAPKLHVIADQLGVVPEEWRGEVEIDRAAGRLREPQTETLTWDQLGAEWEWEESPEVSLAIVDSVDHAIGLFNRYSPRLVASLVSSDEDEHRRFFETVDSPFVGNGFTRWVDGQYALHRPELGLSNWQHGRLLARSGVLSGDSVYTIRTVATQDDPDMGR